MGTIRQAAGYVVVDPKAQTFSVYAEIDRGFFRWSSEYPDARKMTRSVARALAKKLAAKLERPIVAIAHYDEEVRS